MVHQRANGADGGDVVVANQRSEIRAALDEFVGGLVSELGRRDAELELHDKFGRYGQLQIARDGHEAVPAIVGIGTVTAAAHECDFAVAKLVEMAQSKLGGSLLVEHHIRDAFDLAMACDDYGGENPDALFEGRIDKDEALDGAIHEEARILLDQIGLAAVARGEIEVAFFNEVLFDAAEDLHGIAVAEFGNKDADGECLALAQGAREEAGAVVEFGGSLGDPVAGFLRDGTDAGSIIQNQRNGCRREVEVLAQRAQTDGLAGCGAAPGLVLLGMHSCFNTAEAERAVISRRVL